jgi:hypothetical protein
VWSGVVVASVSLFFVLIRSHQSKLADPDRRVVLGPYLFACHRYEPVGIYFPVTGCLKWTGTWYPDG